MGLDILYEMIKYAEYPIRNIEEVLFLLGDERIDFNGHSLDARNVALTIEKYPIHTPADFLKFFIEGCDEYNNTEASELKTLFDEKIIV